MGSAVPCPATVAVLRAHKAARGTMALALARDDALVFADLEGRWLHPERFSRSFAAAVRRCRAETGQDVPVIRLHDLRTHPRHALRDREPLKTVSERLGHASPVGRDDRLRACPARRPEARRRPVRRPD